MSDAVYRTEGARFKPLIALANRAAGRARRRRLDQFRRTMRPGAGTRILDVGCGGASWGPAAFVPEADVTGIDIHPPERIDTTNLTYVQGDARDLTFDADEFDIVYSNSVIEHIAPPDRPAFAAGVRRAGRRYWVQTPNYWFPIEPHALLPGAQFLPRRLRRGYWKAGPRRIEWEESLELLGARELRDLFPDAVILRERIGTLTKSLIAAGPRSRLGPDRRSAGDQAGFG